MQMYRCALRQTALKRRLLIIAIFLLAGAVVNVAVAWGCAAWIDVRPSRPRTGWQDDASLSRDFGWVIKRRDAFGATRVTAMMRRQPINMSMLFGLIRIKTEPQDYEPLAEILPRWSALADVSQRRQIERVTTFAWEDARGWPCRTLRCRWDPTQGSASFSGGISLTPRRSTTPIKFLDMRALPCSPVWQGIMSNTLFYAAILWLVIPGPFVLRRFLRVRRGLCLACGYDLRHGEHEACPECGVTA